MFKVNQVKITSRTSTLRGAFIKAIIPHINPSKTDVAEALTILNQDGKECVYCGDRAQDWDHLNAVVQDKQPTGYITEIQNLVPACGKCNQSRGNREYARWMRGSAKNSPTTRGISDVELRISTLDKYSAWRKPTMIDVHKHRNYLEYMEKLEKINTLLFDAQAMADNILADLRPKTL